MVQPLGLAGDEPEEVELEVLRPALLVVLPGTLASITGPTSSTAVVGVAKSITFSGTGMADGDKAKWIRADLACDSAASSALGGEQTIAGGAASFTFTGKFCD